METLLHIGPFTALDAGAVVMIIVVWIGVGWFIENPPASLPSVSVIMVDYRRDWMRQFVTRQPRIFDATVIDSLRQGTAFFASASMIAIGGGVALIGNTDRIEGLAADLTLQAGGALIEVKIILVLWFLADALLKFVWAHRLFGYCSILMAAVPNEPDDPLALHRAAQAAEINITAAKSFNRGLRSIYFALGAIGWLLGPWGLMVATTVSAGILCRREFASHSRAVMLKRDL
ncbi:MAG: DUF599 domain-containing protein [Pseudomonadota bacterium]